jgi:hypothetical protein
MVSTFWSSPKILTEPALFWTSSDELVVLAARMLRPLTLTVSAVRDGAVRAPLACRAPPIRVSPLMTAAPLISAAPLMIAVPLICGQRENA